MPAEVRPSGVSKGGTKKVNSEIKPELHECSSSVPASTTPETEAKSGSYSFPSVVQLCTMAPSLPRAVAKLLSNTWFSFFVYILIVLYPHVIARHVIRTVRLSVGAVGDELAAAATDQIGDLSVDTTFSHGAGTVSTPGSGWWIIGGAFWLGRQFSTAVAAARP